MDDEMYRVPPKGKIKLKDYDPNDSKLFDGNKKDGKEALQKLNAELETLQEELYAQAKHRVLVVLQAMDTGGKDGVIRAVFEGVNPQGVKVASFKTPTPVELAHDYLWRVHQQTPGKGEMVIFNRSHYEDVLVVRVHNLVPEEVWSRRYQHIREFERMLAEEGTTILKFYLHIDLQEQAERFLARVEDPTKQWKFNPGDLEERARWDDYMKAYEEMLNQTSTAWAPWYVIPSNKKWYRNWLISKILIKSLKNLNMQYPAPVENIEDYHKRLLEMVSVK
ncbi:MAG TPA: polyphosphate kinase 2 family protein [Anaerolineaceae bacterium]|jgi:PPK2 family polyphosphate:nucleotide phosphotransferase|nr:polyphosphate kinase 2 family protein [Anaerolineaceae bacterium]NMD27993.1 polyphosphate kinase 2 family protein [Chloroflexota bacterium]HOA22012.1 polyphosphate kinase 2 family protein [Anaerolineaceae bacterium]HOG77404.1 polyphosphate kinase 2 family protein [Anaerolineaceae bacterium]